MKKIIEILRIFINFFIDIIYACKLIFDYHYDKKYPILKINTLKVILQFIGNSIDRSAFEFYNIRKEDNLYIFYLSLKHKNSLIFQIFCFLHCFIFNQLLYELFWYVLPNNNLSIKIRCKVINKIWNNINNQISKLTENNFCFWYYRDYKKYYNNNVYYQSIKYKIFLLELIINICCWWNTKIIKNNIKSKLFINTDMLFYKVENYY